MAEAKQINELLREKTPAELSKLMKISGKLGNLNWGKESKFQNLIE